MKFFRLSIKKVLTARYKGAVSRFCGTNLKHWNERRPSDNGSVLFKITLLLYVNYICMSLPVNVQDGKVLQLEKNCATTFSTSSSFVGEKITKKPIKLWFFCDRIIWYLSFRVPSIRNDARKKLNSPWLSSVNLFQCLWPSKAHASQAEKNYIRSKRGGPHAVHNLRSDVILLLACEHALHFGGVVKSRRARGTREETRKRGVRERTKGFSRGTPYSPK